MSIPRSVGAHQQRIAAEVRQQPQLDLRVVGRKQLRARRRSKRRANLAPQLRANGNVLQIRIDRRQPARRRGRRLKRGVHARFRIGQQRQRIDVIRFQLRQMPVFQHQPRHFMLLRQLLQHILRRRDGLAFAATHRRRQPQMREQHHAQLLRRIDVEPLARPARRCARPRRSISDAESLPKACSSTAVSMRTPACSMRYSTGASGRSISV